MDDFCRPNVAGMSNVLSTLLRVCTGLSGTVNFVDFRQSRPCRIRLCRQSVPTLTFTIVSGATCQIDVDDCAVNPCLNGGTCYDLVNGYRCTCAPEYVGRTCSESYCDVNNPCRHGATCHGAGRCLCPPGFAGADCSVDQCDLLDCQNGGSCVDGSCVCPAGVIGASCDIVQCSLMICMVRVDISVASAFIFKRLTLL